MKTALITGASSGIGLELAKIHAKNSDNLVLVARSEQKLKDLATELEGKFNIQVEVIAKDLSKLDSAKAVFDSVKSKDIKIDYLINNAGFGDYGHFSETDWEKENNMIQLNITALTQLTKLFLPEMIERKRGKIMNVASVASFLPGPLMAVYYATKAYVLNFSEALNNEVKPHNISVTALCPGPTISGFQSSANLGDSKLFSKGKFPTSKEVSEYGYKAMMKGKAVAIHGASNKFMVFLLRFTPRSWIVKIVRRMQEKK